MTYASNTPLETRLGLKDGQRVAWVGLPTQLSFLALSRLFARAEMLLPARELTPGPLDILHILPLPASALESELPMALQRPAPRGPRWVRWPGAGPAAPRRWRSRLRRTAPGSIVPFTSAANTSIVLLSSRTLPGQEWRTSSGRAWGTISTVRPSSTDV